MVHRAIPHRTIKVFRGGQESTVTLTMPEGTDGTAVTDTSDPNDPKDGRVVAARNRVQDLIQRRRQGGWFGGGRKRSLMDGCALTRGCRFGLDRRRGGFEGSSAA